jgi:hypothetical protein
MATEQPTLGPKGVGLASPCTGRAVPIRENAVLTSAWIAARIISVADARRCCLRFKYTADASGTANRPQIRVMTSAEYASTGLAPAVDNDVWYPATLVDSSPTVTNVTGTKETGATMTVTQPEHGVVVARPGAWTLGEPSDAGTDVWHLKLTFAVDDDIWLYVAAKELGDTDAGDLGLLQIKANISL